MDGSHDGCKINTAISPAPTLFTLIEMGISSLSTSFVNMVKKKKIKKYRYTCFALGHADSTRAQGPYDIIIKLENNIIYIKKKKKEKEKKREIFTDPIIPIEQGYKKLTT
jgi:hypothetical protein